MKSEFSRYKTRTCSARSDIVRTYPPHMWRTTRRDTLRSGWPLKQDLSSWPNIKLNAHQWTLVRSKFVQLKCDFLKLKNVDYQHILISQRYSVILSVLFIFFLSFSFVIWVYINTFYVNNFYITVEANFHYFTKPT